MNEAGSPPMTGKRMGLSPTPRLLWLVVGVWIALVVCHVLDAYLGTNGAAWLLYFAAALLIVAVLVDGLRLPKHEHLQASRESPPAMAVGTQISIAVTLAYRGSLAVQVDVYDHHPVGTQADGLPLATTLMPGEAVTLNYRLRAADRGAYAFGPIAVRGYGPLGLVARDFSLSAPATVRVYPNFKEVARYALFALDNRLSQLGVKRKRRRGEGQDFHQLRDYREGDSIRQIDWKAASRTQKLVSREYQDERDQHIVFLLDTSGRMRSRDGDLSHFDQALNAMLLLTYVALRQGDAVGLLTFGRSQRFLAPGKGHTMLGSMMETVFDLQAEPSAPDYLAAAEQLVSKVRRRALVVVLTNLRDEDQSEIGAAVELLRARHLVLVASLRETVVGDLLATPIESFGDALDVAATRLYLAERYKAFRSLTARGVYTVDVVPKELPIALVNRYLDVKRSGRL
jgi:uncharacterized protein (DUF58 family)